MSLQSIADLSVGSHYKVRKNYSFTRRTILTSDLRTWRRPDHCDIFIWPRSRPFCLSGPQFILSHATQKLSGRDSVPTDRRVGERYVEFAFITELYSRIERH